METSQADAVARAILEPDRRAQEEVRRQRAAEARSLARRRVVAWWSLAGIALGAAVAYVAGRRIASGMIWGGVAGAAVGWAVVWWRGRPGALH